LQHDEPQADKRLGHYRSTWEGDADARAYIRSVVERVTLDVTATRLRADQAATKAIEGVLK
jgi:hypothetical protein